jgi:acyl-CoA thioesterase-1
MACAVIASAVSCSTDGRPQAAGPAQKTGATAEPSSPATNPGEQVRYMALGDSVTQGVGAVDEQTGSFPALVAERWRADGCDVELQNAGISGYTAGQILAEQVPQIKSFAPTLITFQTGGNDIVNGISIDEYRNNVKSVLDAAAGSGARVIVLAQNEWFRSPTGVSYVGDGGAAQRATFDDVMIEEASAHGAEFVDMRPLYAEQAQRGQWVEDGIHPTPEAYQAWAEKLSEAVPAPCKS